MRVRHKITAWKIAASLVVTTTFTFALADDGDKQLEGYERLTESFLEPHGNWTQMNDDYVDGGEAPKYWLTAFSEGPGGQSVI